MWRAWASASILVTITRATSTPAEAEQLCSELGLPLASILTLPYPLPIPLHRLTDRVRPHASGRHAELPETRACRRSGAHAPTSRKWLQAERAAQSTLDALPGISPASRGWLDHIMCRNLLVAALA